MRLRGTPFLIALIMLLLFFVPWLTLVGWGVHWPLPVFIAGTALFGAALISLTPLLVIGHGHRHVDASARLGDTLLGSVWVLFSWSVIGLVARALLAILGVPDPVRSRSIAVAVLIVVGSLIGWGYWEAMRLPRVREVEVLIDRLGVGLDGLRVAVITDTHFGPIERTRWSRRMVARVNELNAELACHVGDLADGPVSQRRGQVAPLAEIRGELGRFYVTGNHEYFSEAQGWLDHMQELGWTTLHNKHTVVERGGSRLVVAGVDDRTGAVLPGHGPDLTAALAGADPDLPVLLLAHQPKQVTESVAAGVDLQLAGHTHGGQIWPFHFLVRLDQPVLAGLSRHGERTQLYTSRGAGFWGPPLRIFAPSEIAILTLRRPHQPN